MADDGPGPRPSRRAGTRAGSSGRVVARQVAQFALAGAVALAVVGVATAVASRRVGQREAVADARTTTVIRAQGVVTPALDDGILEGDQAARGRLDEVVRRDVLDESVVRVKLWRPDGVIVYSDEPALIGTRWDLGEDGREVLATGRIGAEVSELGRPENRYERHFGKLLEVYLPVWTPSGQALLFEAYSRYDLVVSNGRRVWRSFAPIALGALIMLQLVQLPLAWSLARRLGQRLREREALLARALEASDVERRQIAADLHDSVVQDLAGVAYALSASGRREYEAEAERRVVAESAESVRGSIKQLRSLLVDIYPPNFGEVSLESALADVVARARDAGMDARLVVEGLDRELPDHAARLVYRVAQEGVRNVVRHARASSVTVAVGVEGAAVAVEVVDDGRGFDAALVTARQGSGHMGLTALLGLVEDAGGSLAVHPRPEGGTVLRATVVLR